MRGVKEVKEIGEARGEVYLGTSISTKGVLVVASGIGNKFNRKIGKMMNQKYSQITQCWG